MSQIRQITLSGFLICTLILNGCGGSSSSSSSSDDTVGDLTAVTGTVAISQSDLAQIGFDANGSSIQGTIARKIVSDSDMAGISSLSGLTTQATLTSGTVQAYEIQDDGDLEEVGDVVLLDSDTGAYSIPGLEEGKPYVLHVVKTGHDSKGNENSLSQYSIIIPDSDTPTQEPISSKTSAATDFFVKEILNSVNGNTFDHEDVTSVVDTFLDVMTEKIRDEGIRMPSMVADSDDRALEFIDELNETTGFDDLREEVSSDATLIKAAIKTKLTARASKSLSDMSLEEAKVLVQEVFKLASSQDLKSSESDDSLPDFFLTSFAEGLLKGQTITIAQFATAFHNSVNDELLDGALKDDFLTANYISTHILSVVNDPNVGLKKLYDAYDDEEDTTFPPAFTVVFPKDQDLRWDVPNVSANQPMNILQMLVLMGLTGFMGENTVSGVDNPIMDHPDMSDNQIQAVLQVDGGPFDPIVMCSQLELIEDVGTTEVFIQDIRMTPEKTWRPAENSWEQIDNLTAEVELYNKTGKDITSVVLTYPRQSGNGTKALSNVEGNYWRVSPWQEGQNEPNADNYITDYINGTAKITVTMEDDSVTEREVQLHKFSVGKVSWVFPKGRSGYEHEFEIVTMDTNGQDSITPVLSWSTQDEDSLDDGYDLAYELEVSLFVQPIDFNNQTPLPESPADVVEGLFSDGAEWDRSEQYQASKTIFATWKEGRRIRANSFKLPVALPRLSTNIQQNYTAYYESRITPVIIEQSTGKIVSRGYSTETRFSVGTTAPWEVSLQGTIDFPSRQELENRMPRDNNNQVRPGTWKIGLFKTGEVDSVSHEWVNLFDARTAQAFAPLSKGNTPMIATLGTMDSVYGSSESSASVSYALPSFGRTDSLLERRKSYQMIVWYDLTEKPSNDGNWVNNSTAESNKIDFGGASSSMYPLEWVDHAQANLSVEYNGVYLENYSEETGHQRTNLVFDTEAQTFNFELAPWL